jgi:hypothetical protein
MEDLLVVQRVEAIRDVAYCLPDLALLDPISGFKVLTDEFHEIPAPSILHHDAEISCNVVVECFFEFDYILIVERGKDSDLIEGVLLLLLLHSTDPHLLHRVHLAVYLPTDLVDLPEGALANLFDNLEIFK